MKKPTSLYLPLLLLFSLASIAFTLNTIRVVPQLSGMITGSNVRTPLTTTKDGVETLQPEAAAAGIKRGDKILAINDRLLAGSDNVQNSQIYLDELIKVHSGENIRLTIERADADGGNSKSEANIKVVQQEVSIWERVTSFLVMSSLWILLPLISFTLGFWAAFVRPRDPLAWLLLLLLLSIGSIGFDGSTGFTRLIQTFFVQFWGIWMLLFSIYFPERFGLDRRFPFLKWLIIVPLAVIGGINIISYLTGYFGYKDFSQRIFAIFAPLSDLQIVLMMVAIGMFFVILGWKSGTLTNPDSRRRLQLLTAGTCAAMLPIFAVILYAASSGVRGAVFEIVPAWLAILSILGMVLFPVTMAYVIVVQRAMDVSVVVRQGLQYALAKNTVAALQVLIPIIGILAIVPFISKLTLLLQFILLFILLAITFLFSGVAAKAKLWIDRRFFREAYNAEQILSDLSEEVRTMVETKPLLETVSNKISESLHVPQIALLLKNGNGFQPAYVLGYDDAPRVSFDEQAATIDKLKHNEAVTVYADDEDSWINNMPNFNGERESLEKLNSQLLLPFGAKDKLAGFISLGPKRSEAPYTANDLRLLKSVAAQTGLALENSRLTEAIVSETALRERLNREVEIAREVQERLFPQDLPAIEGLDYFGGCRPALGVGGDYYDFFELENGKFGIAIGDVSGKGIGASLMMASLQATLRGQAIHFDEDLATLMCNVNSLVYDTSTSNRYATFFYSQFDSHTKKLTYVNAGHNPPFLFRKTNENYELFRLETGGAVVGMLPPMLISYEQGELQMRAGDLLIGFTDGISEAMNPIDEEWGEERMIEAIKEKTDLSAKEMFDYLVVCADNFADGAKQHDDMTAIIVRLI